MQALLSQRRALDIRVRLDRLRQLDAVLSLNGPQILLLQALYSLDVVSEVDFGAAEDDRYVGTVVPDLRHPFVAHIRERARADHAEANEKHVGLRVGERSQAIVVLLARRVPQAQTN